VETATDPDTARQLYHLPLSAPSRAIRLALAEKGLAATLIAEPVWERRAAFLDLNPSGTIPVLIDLDGTVVSGVRTIFEYLDEAYPDTPLIGAEVADRVEARRLIDWFDEVFETEVTTPLTHEKLLKRFLGLGQPDSGAIRAARENVGPHLERVGWLADRARWLAGTEMTRADLMAAAHLSVVDYLGDVPWQTNASAKDWYAKIKSRPSFRPLLEDYVQGAPPPPLYADLDF
jgi:glutathione S-transferase